jgi:glucose-6-phosphate isomerase, archaeal
MKRAKSGQTAAELVPCQAEALLSSLNPQLGQLQGAVNSQRRLSELGGCFADEIAFEAALRTNDPVIYTLASIAPGDRDGDLHYALAVIQPGRIGREYYMTKGHLHAWRGAAEVYIGLTGQGMMLLEAESTGESWTLPLRPHEVVYVPGHTAHRTVNIGTTPLGYIGIYPSKAGHDYGAIARKNFRKMVIERDGRPVVADRAEFLRQQGKR